jgi:hypothetical protein
MTALGGKANPVLVNKVLDWLLVEQGLFHSVLLVKTNVQEIVSSKVLDSLRLYVEQAAVEHYNCDKELQRIIALGD